MSGRISGCLAHIVSALAPALLSAASLALAGSAAPPPESQGEPKPRRGPDLTVTQFALNDAPAKTYPFLGGVASHAGYVFVPVKFTVANIGTASTRAFKIELKSVADGGPIRQANFLHAQGKWDKPGNIQVKFATGGVADAAKGSPVAIAGPVPPGGKVVILDAVAAVWVGRARERVLLWVVADRADEVPEIDESNNESQPLNVKLP